MTITNFQILDSILEKIDSGGSVNDIEFDNASSKHILIKELVSIGYIEKLLDPFGSGMNEYRLTPQGKKFLSSGGYTEAHNSKQQNTYDKSLDRKSKKYGISIGVFTLIVAILTLLLTIYSTFKGEINNLFAEPALKTAPKK